MTYINTVVYTWKTGKVPCTSYQLLNGKYNEFEDLLATKNPDFIAKP